MSEKDLKINFRYLTGNIACMSVDSVSGKPVHNDVDNEEAIILFNSLVGEKEGCQTVKTLLQENQQLKLDYDLYKDNHSYKNYEVETKDNTIKQLKDVIEEVREYINELYDNTDDITCYDIDKNRKEFLLQILDKAKGESNE